MPSSDDDALVARLLGRSPGAWEELLERHGGSIESACRRVFLQAGLLPDAPDAAAEVHRRLLEDDGLLLRRFRPGSSLGAYLHVIARGTALNLARRKSPLPLPWLETEAGAEAPEEIAQAAERALALRRALERLGAGDREVLELFYLEGRGYAEISRRTGASEDAVGVRLSRARERLASLLGKDFLEFL